MPSRQSIISSLQATGVIARAMLSREGRMMAAEMRAMQRTMPRRYHSLTLPDFLAELTPKSPDWRDKDEKAIRKLADALAFWDRKSPFGLCLRRSLLRYHFLRRAGLPLGVVFAVRQRQPDAQPGVATGIAGHAWNTLHGQAWHEQESAMTGFAPIYRWPEERPHD